MKSSSGESNPIKMMRPQTNKQKKNIKKNKKNKTTEFENVAGGHASAACHAGRAIN